MFFNGEHLEIFFIEEFFTQNSLQNIETIPLGEFWVKMLHVYVKMRRKGIELDLVNINFSRRKVALINQQYKQSQLTRNLGYQSNVNSPPKPSSKRL
jgi:hypothetical protein